MTQDRKIFSTIDDYIAEFPDEIQEILEKIRKLILETTHHTAMETITYQMPTFKLKKKNLIHFAAFKNHLGIYPTPSAITKFAKELSTYETSKGAIRFPWKKPIPYDLIRKIVQFRVQEIEHK